MNGNRKFGVTPERWPFFYGWFVLGIGAIGVLMSVPGQTVGVSVFIDPLIEVLATSRSAVSLTYMIGTLAAAAFLPVMGRLFDRKGATFMATLAGAALGGCIVYMAAIDVIAAGLNRLFAFLSGEIGVIIGLSVGFFLIRLWGQGVITMVSRNMVMKWFDRRRGLANGILGFVTTIGFSLSPPVLDWLIRLLSWRGAYLVLAAVVGLFFPVVARLFFRDRPHDHGLVPDGTSRTGHSKASRTALNGSSQVNYTLREARITSLFRYVVATLFISSAIETAVTFHIISIFQESGLSRAAAVRFFFPVYLVSICAHFIGSWLSDYVENKYFALVQLFGVGLSSAMLVVLAPGISLWLLILGQGLGHGMNGICSIVLWPRYFGTKHLGAIYGCAMLGGVIGSAFGPFLFSLSIDLTGSYRTAGLIGVIVTVSFLGLAARSFIKRGAP